MEFVPTDEYIKVSLQEGLNALQIGRVDKLFSDGLDDYEYIYFNKEKGFCYEDNCVIGSTFDQTSDGCISLEGAIKLIEKGKQNYRVLSAWVDTFDTNNQKVIVFHECYVNAIGNIE